MPNLLHSHKEMFHIREDFNTSRHFVDFDKVHLRFVTPSFIFACLTVESSAFEGNSRLGSARIKWPLSHSKSISTGMMMVLKILTKQFVNFTNGNDFLVSWPWAAKILGLVNHYVLRVHVSVMVWSARAAIYIVKCDVNNLRLP